MLVVEFSNDLSTLGHELDVHSVQNRAHWRLVRDGYDISDSIRRIDVRFDPATARFEAVLQLASTLAAENDQLRILDAIEDRAGPAIDGDGNGTAGGWQFPPGIAMDDDGDFVIVWGSETSDGSGLDSFARLFDANGVPQGTDFRVNSFRTFDPVRASAAMDANGDFLISWMSFSQDGSDTCASTTQITF